MLMFGAKGETRERWIETADSDEFRRELAADWPEARPEDVEEMLAGNKRFADRVVVDALHLIDAPLDHRHSTTGEFLFHFNDDAIPVTVTYTLIGDTERLELHFTTSSEQRDPRAGPTSGAAKTPPTPPRSPPTSHRRRRRLSNRCSVV